MAAIKKSETFPGYKLITYDDGTYGYVMADGKSKVGYKSKDGAKKAAKKLAANAALITPHTLTDIEQALADELSALYDDAAKYLVNKAKNFVDKQQGKQYDKEALNALIKQCTTQIAKTNTDAVAAINGYAPVVAAEQANFAEYAIEDDTTLNPSFTLLNQDTVLRLIKDSPAVLPKAKAKIEKNKRWNTPKLRSALTHAIVQGDSIPKLTKKVEEICGSNKAIATRNARTMMTGARNAGTLAAYVRAEQNGMHIQKQWMAALDERTRASHRHLDGEIKPVTEKFSNGLMHPGDTSGSPAEVYNCRCTMVPIVNDQLYTGERASKLKDVSYEEWKAVQPKPKSKQTDAQPAAPKVDNQQQQQQQATTPASHEIDWYKPATVAGSDSDMLDPENMNWVNKVAYDNYTSAIAGIKSYNDLGEYIDKKLHIPVKSGYFDDHPDKVNAPLVGLRLIRAKQLVAMIEQYSYLGDMPNLKGISFLTDDYFATAKYIKTNVTQYAEDAGWMYIRSDGLASSETVVKAFAEMCVYGGTPNLAKFDGHIDAINAVNPNPNATGEKDVVAAIQRAFTSDSTVYAEFFTDLVKQYPQKEQSIAPTSRPPKVTQPAPKPKSEPEPKPKLTATYAPVSQSTSKPKPKPVKKTTIERGDSMYVLDKNDYQPVPTKIKPDVDYSHEYDFTTWESADAYARKKTGEVWRGASAKEKKIANRYTGQAYALINARLNGYADSMYSTFKGIHNTELAEGTIALTNLISRSKFDDAIVVTRRDSSASLSSFTGISKDDLYQMRKHNTFNPADFVGKSNRFMAFLSSSISRDGKFGKDSSHWVEYEIHCPPGAEMLYCEPFSQYGGGSGKNWDGYEPQTGADEREMLLQRGGSYTIVDIVPHPDKVTIVMELNLEDGYDKYGKEEK
jgi:SPP1 gp7 family putative phage head morphogenesis protein